MEFALAWPVALLLVVGCVQLSIWGVETYAAHAAALAGARAAAVAGADAHVASQVTLRSINPSLAGARALAWCPGDGPQPSAVWVCVTDRGTTVEVSVGGEVPALIPLLGAAGLPLHADTVLNRETFAG